jgi:hypothetical protein
MYEQLRFITRLLNDGKMAAQCREFHISLKAGCTLIECHKICGLEAPTAVVSRTRAAELSISRRHVDRHESRVLPMSLA